MYGDFLKSNTNCIYILLLCFVRIIYHSKFIKVLDKNPGNLFYTLSVLQDEKLQENLKRLVIRKSSDMMKVTAVSPHIIQLKILTSIKTRFNSVKTIIDKDFGNR